MRKQLLVLPEISSILIVTESFKRTIPFIWIPVTGQIGWNWDIYQSSQRSDWMCHSAQSLKNSSFEISRSQTLIMNCIRHIKIPNNLTIKLTDKEYGVHKSWILWKYIHKFGNCYMTKNMGYNLLFSFFSTPTLSFITSSNFGVKFLIRKSNFQTQSSFQ